MGKHDFKICSSKGALKYFGCRYRTGFFAIILAQKGHQVTAVDLTRDMLEQAKENANYYKVKIEFELLKNQLLPFPDNDI